MNLVPELIYIAWACMCAARGVRPQLAGSLTAVVFFMHLSVCVFNSIDNPDSTGQGPRQAAWRMSLWIQQLNKSGWLDNEPR